MLLRARSALAAAVVGATIVVTSSAARAEGAADARRCISDSERGQEAVRDGHPSAAIASFAECASEACPAVIRADCAHWLEEARAEAGRVRVKVHDDRGRPVADGRVLVDSVVVERDGVTVDPGAHVVRAEAPGLEPAERRVTVASGADVEVDLVLAPPPPPAPPPVAAPTPSKREVPPIEPRPKWPAVAAAVVAVGALGGALWLDLDTTSHAHELRDRCAPRCSEDDVAPLRTRYAVAATLLGVGVVAAGVAVWLYVRAAGAGTRTRAAAGDPLLLRF